MRIKRGMAPKFWKIETKTRALTTSPSAGPHPAFSSIPLRIIIRDILGISESASEAKAILNAGKVQIDGITRKDPGFPVGLMDVVHIPDTQKYYRVMPSAKGLMLKEMTKDYDKKMLKIKNKRTLGADKVQLNFHDGTNTTLANANYNPNDAVVVKLPSKEIVSHVPLETGVSLLITGGKNIGKIAKLKKIERISGSRADELIVETENGDHKTQVKFVFAIGKGKPLIDLGE
ncbi:MAG: 30S ribosomal protein S4e [Candidatus Aenigmarchaeota archaeon]|nr:30S ribosomal protein S4e [Candidatus Aenigmarchaeota archaeon]